MENNIEQKVLERIKQRITMPFDPFFADAWRIFKKASLITAAAFAVVGIPFYIINTFFITPYLMGFSSYFEYLRAVQREPFMVYKIFGDPMFMIKISIYSIFLMSLMAPIMAGFLKMAREADKDEQPKFSSAFYYFKATYYFRILAVVFIPGMVHNLMFALCFQAGTFGILLFYPFAIAYSALIIFCVPLVIFGNATPMQAIRLSIKLGIHKFWTIIGYTFLFGLMACVGAIACGIGVLFTMCFIPIFIYLLYKYSVGFPEDQIEEPHWQQPQTEPPIS